MADEPVTAPSRRAYRRLERSAGDPSRSRTGRNLPAAIGVGVGLGVVIIAALVLWKPSFLLVVIAAVVVGAWELIQALGAGRVRVPAVPTMLGALTLPVVAYLAGSEGLVVGATLTLVAILLWRALDGLDGAIRDIAGGAFVVGYLCVPAGVAVLMLAETDGAGRIFVFLITTVSSDIGGYALGVVAGRHPMAPSVSPKKSWEGFAGSVLSCMLAGAITVVAFLDGPWWGGLLLGAAVAVAATLGDLAESTLKRDLGIKDMGSLLPGHGGVMDRLDSLVVSAPVCWVLLQVLVPV
jgi:phosphatidate cytidylyltransferase